MYVCFGNGVQRLKRLCMSVGGKIVCLGLVCINRFDYVFSPLTSCWMNKVMSGCRTWA